MGLTVKVRHVDDRSGWRLHKACRWAQVLAGLIVLVNAVHVDSGGAGGLAMGVSMLNHAALVTIFVLLSGGLWTEKRAQRAPRHEAWECQPPQAGVSSSGVLR